MAVLLGDATVLLRPDASDFPRNAEEQITGPMGKVAGKVAGVFAAAFAAVQLGGFLKDSIGAASDLSESASKVGVVFGDAADQVLAFGANASTSLGQSRAQALEAAGTFGNLLRSLGLTEQASADMSTTFVGLASDLASFNNTDPAEALEALRSGLTGETEPLKNYGINLNQATIQAEAMRLGLVAAGEDLSASAQAQAAYSLILSQSALAQGDFARTSAGLANQQRIVSAQFVDLQSNIGGLFVPLVANAAGIITGRLMPALLTATAGLPALGDAVGRVGDVFRLGFSDGALAVNDATAGVEGLGFQVLQVAGTAGDMAAVFREAFADGRAGADLLASGSFPGMAAQAGVAADSIRDRFGVAFGQLQTQAGTALVAVQGQLPALRESFAGVFDGIVTAVAPALGRVRDAFTAALPELQAAFSGLFSGLGGDGGGGGGLSAVVGVITSVLEAIGPLISGYIGRYADLFAALIPAVTAIITSLLPVISSLVSQIGPLLSALLPVISTVTGALTGALVTAITALVPVIPPLVSAIGAVVTALAGGLLSAVQAIVPVIPPLVAAIGGLVPILAGALVGALQAVVPILPVIAGAIASLAPLIATLLVSALNAVLPILPVLVQALGLIAQAIGGALVAAVQAILPVLPLLVQVVLTLIQNALTPLLPILPTIAGLIGTLATLFATVVAALAPLLPVLVQLISLAINLVVTALTPLISTLPIIVGLFGIVVQAVLSVINFFVSLLATVVSIVGGILGVVASLVGGVVGFFSNMVSSIGRVVGGVYGSVVGVFQSIAGAVSSVIGGLVGGISSAFGSIAGTVSGIFSGISNTVSGAFASVGGVLRNAVNGAIGVVNSALGVINGLIGAVNNVPGVDIPRIPLIPRLHSGGVFDSGQGEGLALLRDQELVATPEQRVVADDLLRSLLAGKLPTQPQQPGQQLGGGGVQIDVHAAPGQDEGMVATLVGAEFSWHLATRTTSVPILEPVP